MSSAATGTIVVFAKEPRPGRVKTRLCPPLDRDEAALLYASLLDDVLEATAAFAARLGLAPVLALEPAAACAGVASRAPTPFRVVGQRGRDLGARMGQAVLEAHAAGFRRVLLRGSDSPLLDGSAVEAALAALDAADLAVSPDRDGGYNLVALRRFAPGLFDHPMSTASVLDDTLERAASAGLRSVLLEPGFDIDTASDLALLAAARSPAAERLCPRTYALLDERDLWRFTRSL